MNNIKVMDELLANKIAAGEVVLNPASVVKELIENAIDAGSSEIKILLLESGIKEIKIIDNGSGMNNVDAKVCFLRHATSKIKDENDLFSINTLGFRGEALPSIAAVSKVFLQTGTGNASTVLELKNGVVVTEKKGDARIGTSITIKSLFYNTPARLKYLKSLPFELALVTGFVNKIALSHPEIKFILSNNDKSIITTSGSSDLLKTINEIYGLTTAKNMLKINNENNDFLISGFISKPEITRSNRNHMTLIVNGRIVKNLEINRVINEAYHTYKPENKFPISVIIVDVDPTLIDVNIHPAKQDIKFSKFDKLKELISETIKNALRPEMLIPKIENNNYLEPEISSAANTNEGIAMSFDFGENIVKEETDIYLNKSEGIEKLPFLEPVGIIHGTYIVFQNPGGMYLIDQHAAKERINYEKYLHDFSADNFKTIDLLVPLTIQYPKEEFIILNTKREILKEIGIDFEDFGINTIMIKAHPIWLQKGYEAESIKKIIDIVLENNDFKKEKFLEKVAITLSCKLSIKANTNVTTGEMEQLVTDLRKTDNPYTCPHGRPTVISYSKYELEKLFKRAT